MEKRLEGKVAVITGGAGGIGLETAKSFLDEGAEGILLVDLEENQLKDAAKSLESDNVKFFRADVSKSDDVKAYTEKAIQEFGRMDVLFLNAGIEGVVKPLT